jgi:hypothetical protein
LPGFLELPRRGGFATQIFNDGSISDENSRGKICSKRVVEELPKLPQMD